MAILRDTKNDALDITAFPDDVASYYLLGERILAKIATYRAAAEAAAQGTATQRQATFLAITGVLVAPEDLPRIAALVDPVTAMQTFLSNGYADFLA